MKAETNQIAETKESLIFQITYGTPSLEYHQTAMMEIEQAVQVLTDKCNSIGSKMGYNVYDCRNNAYSKIVILTK